MAASLTLPFSWDAVRGVFDAPPYDASAVRELFMLIGPPGEAADKAEPFAFHLNELCKAFAFELWGEVQQSTPQREAGAKALAAACQKVLAIVGVDDGGELFPMFGVGGLFAAAAIRGEARGEAATMNALRAVDALRLDALKMLEIEAKRRRMKPPKAGRPESRVMQKLLRDLSCLYENTWEDRSPGVSLAIDGEPSGPFLRLMVDVTDRLKAIMGRRAFSATRASLRKAWQRIQEKMPLAVTLAKFKAFAGESAPLSK